MNIRKGMVMGLLLTAAVSTVAWKQAMEPEAFTVNGNVEGFKDSIVFLSYGTFSNSKLDSTKVVNGKFTFTGKIAEPLTAMLFSRDYRLRQDLFIDKGVVTIEGKSGELTVTGSPVVNEYAALDRKIMSNRKWVNMILMEAYQVKKTGDTVRAKMMEADANRYYGYELTLKRDFIKEHPSSPISARELLMFVNDKTLEESTHLYEALSPAIKASEQGQELTRRMEILNSVKSGKKALPFTQTSVDGKKITLDSYKGKYVLVEFWASWCGPCRAENPNLRRQVEIFGPKGFNVLGVSLDKTREPWIKAIKDDGLTWPQVSDLKGWNNEVAVAYGIKAVPANFLIDPSGTIIAQDLRGEKLNEKLREIFK